jgi:thiol-disulfide isomerase/thioredoxin
MSRRRARTVRARTVRAVAAAATVAALALTGCTAQTGGDENTRTGSQTGYIGGQSLTRIPPDQRRPAPIATGPSLADPAQLVSSGDYPGKIVVVNVWGSWCAPCRKEAPELVAVSRSRGEVAQLIGLDIRDYDPAPAAAFIRAFDVPYPQIYDPRGTQLVKYSELPPNGIPSTLIIDRQGRIAVRIVGTISRATLTQMIDDLAAER